VRRWWRDAKTLEQVEDEYAPSIEGSEPTRVFLIELDGKPAGMI
jgi:hypothetical protein